jgi:hypothetical protein
LKSSLIRTGIYDDRILANTSEWISTNELCTLIKGDNTKIKGANGALRDLKDMGQLETRTVGNLIEYRRIDQAIDNHQFDVMMASIFEYGKDIAFEEMKKMNYSMTTKNKKITKKGKELLDYVQSDLFDRSFMVMTRLRYQEILKMLPHTVINQRLQTIQKFIESVMKELDKFEEPEIIKEQFQNHTHKLEPFKV